MAGLDAETRGTRGHHSPGRENVRVSRVSRVFRKHPRPRKGASGLAGSRHTAYRGKVVQGGAGAFTYGKRSLWDTPCNGSRALAFLGLSEVRLPGARVCAPWPLSHAVVVKNTQAGVSLWTLPPALGVMALACRGRVPVALSPGRRATGCCALCSATCVWPSRVSGAHARV